MNQRTRASNLGLTTYSLREAITCIAVAAGIQAAVPGDFTLPDAAFNIGSKLKNNESSILSVISAGKPSQTLDAQTRQVFVSIPLW